MEDEKEQRSAFDTGFTGSNTRKRRRTQVQEKPVSIVGDNERRPRAPARCGACGASGHSSRSCKVGR